MPKKWQGQKAAIELSGGSLPADPIGVINDPEVSAPEQEVQELRGAGSVKWQDLQRTSISVTVTGEVMAWDAETWDRLVDYDEAQGELNDSADVPTFTVTVEFNASDGSTKEIPIINAYVDGSIPAGGSRDEWTSLSLQFVGQDLGSITNTDASA
jgi:hypothetical protein